MLPYKTNIPVIIVSISLRSLRNASFITFTDGVEAIGGRHNLTSLGLKPVYDAFVATLGPLNALYATEKGSLLTTKIQEADRRRDRAVSGIRQVVEGYTSHFDPALAEDAERVKRVFDKYGSSIQDLNYSDQTGVMKSLAEDLQAAPISASVNRLGLTAWVTEMKDSNNAFVDLYGNRTTEKSQKPTATMLELRQVTQDAWKNLVASIKAVHVLNTSPALQAYAAELNAHIEPYLRLIGKGGGDEDTPGDPEPPQA